MDGFLDMQKNSLTVHLPEEEEEEEEEEKN
jgi:hypothetical protein